MKSTYHSVDLLSSLYDSFRVKPPETCMLMIINHSLIEEENTFTEHLASKIIYYKAGKLSLRLFQCSSAI